MFYGASKNKNGKDISDYDKYKPWKAEDFSGKIKYTLDNFKQFEIFREFNKKNPKIYNENLEDISNSFNIDKTKGNQFFIEQTGIDENLFFNTMTICQNEVVLDDSKQNTLVQKITNVVSSGDDNTSYKKTMDKLNKKLLEEIGTARTSGRPINIIEDEIKTLEEDKENLESYKVKLQNIEKEKEETRRNLDITKNELNILKEIKEYKQSESLEEQKIGINTNKLNEYNKKLDELKRIQSAKKEIKRNCINPVILLLIAIVITGSSVILKNMILSLAIGIISALLFVFNSYRYSRYKKILNQQNEGKIENNKAIEIIQSNIKQCITEIESDREKLEKRQNEEREYIINRYGNTAIVNEYIFKDINEIEQNIEHKRNEYNEIMLNENTIDIEKNNTSVKLENLVNKVERLQYLYEQRESLRELSNSINLAEQGLEEAYKIMKNTITPKFTNELTKIIAKVTSGEYKKVNFNDDEGLTVELENGEYVNCSRLSIGMIDQMYLALRLSILNEISKETMPIVLDEAFVYYDKSRLENILKYVSEEYVNRQIIILTCTDREIEVLNNLNVQYNLINM